MPNLRVTVIFLLVGLVFLSGRSMGQAANTSADIGLDQAVKQAEIIVIAKILEVNDQDLAHTQSGGAFFFSIEVKITQNLWVQEPLRLDRPIDFFIDVKLKADGPPFKVGQTYILFVPKSNTAQFSLSKWMMADGDSIRRVQQLLAQNHP